MKQDPEEYFRNLERIGNLVARFESKQTNDHDVWFDSEDIEDICNYYIDLGKFDKAEQVLQLGERLHPTDELMPMLRAHLLIEKLEPQKALELIDWLQYTQDFYWHYLRLGALADLERWAEALSEADNALQFDNDNIAATLDIARVFSNRNQHKHALHYLKLADEANINDADKVDLLKALGECLAELELYKEALPYIDRWINVDPYSVEAWCIRATLEIDLGRYDLALDNFDYALAIEPKNETALITKSKLLFMLSRDQEALQVLEDIAGISKQWKGVSLMMQGDMYFWKGNYNKAHAYYYKGFNKLFFLADSVVRYMECKAALHKWRGVITLGSFLLRFNPNDTKVLELMSDAYFELKELSNSAKMLRKCVKLEPENVYMLLRYGSLMLDMNDIKKAYSSIHRAYLMAPDISQTNLLMAVVCYLRGENKRMYQYYRKACKMDRSSRTTFLQLIPDLKPYINRLDSIVRKYEKEGIKNIEQLLFDKK